MLPVNSGEYASIYGSYKLKIETMPGRLIIVSGPSGVGKGTLLKRALAELADTHVMSVSATTRAPRPGERHGMEYYFLSREDFARKKENGEFLESAEVFASGDWYGTLEETVRKELEAGKSVVLEIDVEGTLLVLQRLPATDTIFIEPPSLEQLEQRLAGRGTETPERRQTRLKRAIEELKHAPQYKYRIVNDDLDLAVAQLKTLLTEIHRTAQERGV